MIIETHAETFYKFTTGGKTYDVKRVVSNGILEDEMIFDDLGEVPFGSEKYQDISMKFSEEFMGGWSEVDSSGFPTLILT